MKLSWDETKRQVTLRKRGLDFAHAAIFFDRYHLTFEDNRYEYTEECWVTIGLLGRRVVVLVHIDSSDDDVVRIISMREATRHERNLYYSSSE